MSWVRSVVKIIPLVFLATTAQAALPVVEADNGEHFRITDVYRMNGAGSDRGTSFRYVVATVVNDDNVPAMYTFSCDGYYASVYGGMVERRIPPRSVLAGVSRIACKTVGR